ncbi:hypothetical protein C6P40_000907 [Pichia californica]|uniref:Dienelactone hydrolase domain-containing protein n=1 Tax=Pichia californica TaxID=460514 RepID=A0A9P6WK84_9ASCO|nr:hypothetical protein C6P42_004812 [[Candida] californica]KAG0688497.1 hypothetical protein C6P40_000907 [[Candida] californica]
MSSNPPSENCCAKVTLHSGKPQGSIEKIGNLNCYVTSNFNFNSEKYLFIFPDIFGIELVNTQLVADKFSDCLNYPVIIIDIVNNDPFKLDGLLDFPQWKINHPVELTVNLIKEFFIDFEKNLKNNETKAKFLAGIGYCFGAKYLSHYLTKDGLLDVGAFAHPSFVDEDELSAIRKPLIISCAETDSIFPRDLRFKSEEILSNSKIPYQIDLYSQTEHGFAVRGDMTVPQVKYAAEKALTDQVLFFKFHDSSDSSDSSGACKC